MHVQLFVTIAVGSMLSLIAVPARYIVRNVNLNTGSRK